MIRINRQYNKSSEQEKVLNFLSRNFYRISEFINIEYLNENELEIILSSPELKIESEDCLFDFISSFELPKYCFLFDYNNVDIINNYEMIFHRQLWKSICRRLVMNSKQMNKNQNPRTIEIKQETIECSKGIIDYLRNESNINNNPYESKLIEVEKSIIKDGQIKNLFDNTIDTHFRLKNVENGFILLDFKDKRINFSKYYFSVPSS